jgi:Carboxypeptidase regulatory-like domain
MSALTGLVVMAPTCPGPQAVDSSCPPRAVVNAQVTVLAGGQALVTTTTDASGRFTVRLPPGSYVVTARSVSGRRWQVTATVQLPRSQDLELTIDSGIR